MKYLELIKGQFTADHEARAKQQEPYVAYSEEAGGVMYTFIPEPVVGPADNEIWYTTEDKQVIEPNITTPGGGPSSTILDRFGANIISNTYSNLGIIKFDNNIDKIGEASFMGFENLTEIYIPKSVKKIGSGAFTDCYNLTSIIFIGTIEEWDNITKGYNWNNQVPTTYVQCSDGQVAL